MKLVEFSNGEAWGAPISPMEGVKEFSFYGGISLIAKAALLKSASNHLRRGVWVGVPLPPLTLNFISMGNIYNLMNGVNPATFFFLPMLGNRPEVYPRFRDCFITKDKEILILTRLGHEDYEEEQEQMRAFPNYVEDYVMEDDQSYRMFVYKCPPEWEADWDIMAQNKKPSAAYIEQMCKIYPKLEDKFRERYEKMSHL